MSAAFSTHDSEAISRSLDIQVEPSPEAIGASLDDLYEIAETAKYIVDEDFKRIALQFPDELLPYSVPIFRALKAKTPGRELYVLADTSYGSCCVDEVAAQHIDADAVVHYGHACLSPTTRLPTIYVLGKRQIDVSHCVESLLATSGVSFEGPPHPSSSKNIALMFDVAYAHQADNVCNGLRAALPDPMPLIMSNLKTRLVPPTPTLNPRKDSSKPEIPKAESNTSIHSAHTQPHRHNILPPEIAPDSTIIFYIGGESLGLTNILMTHSTSEIYSYDPMARTSRHESIRTNRLLMRRYAIVQRARDADVFGILVGTLGVAAYLPLIAHLRKTLSAARKKSYTISVGKLNPAKLANFMEIECFVLVACPENSVVDAKEFHSPIITPYELEIALSPEPMWTGRYVLDFEQVLAESSAASPRGDETSPDAKQGEEDEESDTDRPTFSLISGKYRQAKRYGEDPRLIDQGDVNSGALTVRNNESAISRVMESAAGDFLQARSYRGLEQRLGEDAPSVLEQGRSGIAMGYHELTNGVKKLELEPPASAEHDHK